MAAPRKRTPLIAGNWKMHTSLDEARALAQAIVAELNGSDPFRVGLFPPAVSLAEVAAVARQAPCEVVVGAQNMHHEEAGAFTGEISARMVVSCGARAVLLGHSERRHVFGETNDEIGRKVERALKDDLIPVLCVGETLEERDGGKTTEVVGRQVASGIEAAKSPADLARIIIAYEPVWAIGTGRTATPEQAQEVHQFIRSQLRREFSDRGGDGTECESVLVLYGGSVKPENARGLLEQADIDGALVGGASLKPDSFLGICRAALPAG